MSVTDNHVAQIINATQRQTTLDVDFVTADVIGVSYNLMPGTRPADAGCVVAIWQDDDQIPWDNPPIKTQAIGAQQRGSVSFTGLSVQRNQYIVGLAVGPMRETPQKAGNVAASIYVPGENEPKVQRSDFLSLTFVGQTSLAVQFNCLGGYRAGTNGAWMGLWRGSSASYSQPPDWAIPVKPDTNFGTVSFNDISIGIGLTYTVGLFKTGWNSDPNLRSQRALATSLTFTEGQG